MIATDRRVVVLANQRAEILLANQPAQRIGLDQGAITAQLSWGALCARARRAGSVPLSWQDGRNRLEGEVVHIPMGPAEGYLLRLAENEQETTWLRNRSRSATLMRVAHDLRTPIQSLLAAADRIVRKRAEPAESEQTLEQMRRAAELALDHISNVLSVIQGEQSVRGGQPDEDFRIVDEITSMVALVEPIAAARATRIGLTIDAPADLTLKGPLRFVRALCQNLIDNSVNHGGGQIDLLLTCRPLAESGVPDSEAPGDWYVGIELKDEGGGLPYSQKKRLAEALGLLLDSAAPHGATQDNRPSAGLNVLAHALRQLGGRIEINDRGSDGNPLPPGSEARVIGTVFRASFTLPRAPDMTHVATAPAEGAVTALSGQTLVLVEDSPSTRDWLAHVLQSFGAQVFSAGSGPEALALLSRQDVAEKVGLVLTDVSLPRMSGIELARRLTHGDPASASAWRGVIVGLTAHADDAIRDACREAGMACILQKPIPPARLCAALVDALAGSALADDIHSARVDVGPSLVDPSVISDLFARFGSEPARGFIHRALDEAQSVIDELREDGIGLDTGRRLHAATGAAGMTGLMVVESHLRDLEAAIEAGAPELDLLLSRIELELSGSRQFINTLE